MHRSALAAVALAVALGTVVAGCGGGTDDAADTTTSTVFVRPTVPPTTASPPPPTLAPVATTVPGATAPPTAPPTTAASTIVAASASAVSRLVGNAEWDATLPIPADCISNATFTPSGPDGVNGGVVQCTAPFPIADVAAFVDGLNHSRHLAGVESGAGTTSVHFSYGSIAILDLTDSGGTSTSFRAVQSYG